MSEIDPKVWQMMLQVPGWTPPTEATLLRHIMEGRAKVVFAQFLHRDDQGFMFVTIGEQTDADREDASDMMMHWIERAVNRKRQERDKRPAQGIETRRAETSEAQALSRSDEGPIGAADAPNPSLSHPDTQEG